MKTAFRYRHLLELPTFEYGCFIELNQEGDQAEARGTDEQPISDMPLLIRCGGTCSAWQ